MKEQKNEEQFWEKERKLRKSIVDLEDDKKNLEKLCEIIENEKLSQIKLDYIKEQILEDETEIKRLKGEYERLIKEHEDREIEQ